MLYTLKGNQSNGKICTPATDKEIFDYCLSNPQLARAIAETVKDNEYQEWKKEVTQEFAKKMGISFSEAEETVENEIECLYKSGITMIMEAVNELSISFKK